MITVKSQYEGQLRTTAQHVKSGNTIQTDAPTDNNGKGEAFSPTDLVSTALSCCMITLMGIAANKHGFVLGNARAEVDKIMGSDPRRIQQVIVRLELEDTGYTDKEKKIMEKAALNCPVAKSLSAELIQTVSFSYIESLGAR